jgi:tRNA A-37 threonylcarbamoyl transferase component Bud32
MAVCDGYVEGVRSHLRVVNDNEIRYLLVERELIESDVRRGSLGDFLTDKLLYPHRALKNPEYLNQLALQLRIRLIREQVQDLVFEYGEMSRGLVIEPEYFALARMRTRARIFTPSMGDYLRLLDPSVRSSNISALRSAFGEASHQLSGELVELEEGRILLSEACIDRNIKHRASGQVINILKKSQNAFYSYLTKGRTIFPNLDLLARELYEPFRWMTDPEPIGKTPEDPKNFLYVKTTTGLVSVNEESSLEEAVSKIRPSNPITIIPLAGVLNEVFLVTSGKDQFVAKRFTDWHGFKWFTLNLVSIGSKLFSLSGKARMTNEYGINRYLAKRKIHVPEIVHVSLNERMLLEEYIPGEPLDRSITMMVNQTVLTHTQVQLAELLGETLGRIHAVGVSVGDSKPENFVSKGGMIYTVDLEQAGKKGDYGWDIAELLYYSGHYSRNALSTGGLVEMMEGFLRGYLKWGEKSELKRAAGVRYAKVFSIWTPAPILLQTSKMLRES